MTYAPAKFEVDMSNGLGGNPLLEIFDLTPRSHEAMPSTSCALRTCKVWNCYSQWLRRCIYKKIHYLTLPQGQGGQGHTKRCPIPLTSCDLCTSNVWCRFIPRLRRICIYKKIYYLTLTWNVAQCPLHHVTYAPTEFEVTTSKGLGGDAFTRTIIIWPWSQGQSHRK